MAVPAIPVRFFTVPVALVAASYFVRQCRKPSGPLGRFVVWSMNLSHSGLTAWGIEAANIQANHTILDVGCGGGRTIERLASLASEGKIYGVDYSAASVAVSQRHNRAAIDSGRVQVRQADVSSLPFSGPTFDLVTAIETHYYWPDRPRAFAGIFRLLKPGGMFLIVAEAYQGSWFGFAQTGAMKWIGGQTLTVDQHRELLAQAGFVDVNVVTSPAKGWIRASGVKPA